MASTSLPRSTETIETKPLLQSLLEGVTGRNLDPVRITHSAKYIPVPNHPEYNQSIYVRTVENLRTGEIRIYKEKGGVA